jgi:aldehyde dehydrogenase
MQATEAAIRQVVQEVLSQLGRGPYVATAGKSRDGAWGVFKTVDQAVQAATGAFEELSKKGLEERRRAIDCVRRISADQAEELGRLELEETKIGRLDHKIEKLKIVKLVPGVEFLKTDCLSGDHGLTLTE